MAHKITCDDPQLHASNGSVSSMPGSHHPVPDGAKCDQHANYTAYYRVQGETDSMGCEYNLMCAECYTSYKAEVAAAREEETHCDYCKTMQVGCSPMRDFEEGLGGPVYNVCGGCRKRVNDRIAEEFDEFNEEPDYCYDDGDYRYATRPRRSLYGSY